MFLLRGSSTFLQFQSATVPAIPGWPRYQKFKLEAQLKQGGSCLMLFSNVILQKHSVGFQYFFRQKAHFDDFSMSFPIAISNPSPAVSPIHIVDTDSLQLYIQIQWVLFEKYSIKHLFGRKSTFR